MSDITHSRRAQEHLEYYDASQADLPGDDLIKAGVHAALATARATRELDSTTRQVNRLLGDSVDELATDMVKLFRRRPLLVHVDNVWVNPSKVSVVRQHSDPDMTVLGLSDGDVAVVRGTPGDIANLLTRAVS